MAEKYDAPMTITVTVNNVALDMVLVTGAACSLLSIQTFERFFGRLALRPCSDQLFAYNGDKIKILGEFSATIVYKETKRILPIVVSDTLSPPILGRNFVCAFNMGLSQINLVNSYSEVVNDLLTKFSPVFEGGLGKFTGETIHLNFDDGARPVFCKPRPIPMAWKPEVKRQIWNLVDEDMLERVETSQWSTLLLLVVKLNGKLRVCGDYKTTIKRHLDDVRHPLPCDASN